MKRLRCYQLSLRRLLWLTATVAATLWLALSWFGRITPAHGESLVAAAEQQVLQTMKDECGLVYSDSILPN